MVAPVDGISLRELFRNDINSRNKPIPFRHEGRAALVDNNYKLVTLDIGKEEFELYDLVNDPNETNNIIKEEKEVAIRLIQEFNAWNQSVEKSVEGKDYPNGLLEPNGYRVFWNTLPQYKPYFEEWKNRPEYKGRIINPNR